MADVSIDPQSNDSKELVKVGNRAYALRDYNGAVAAFSRAIELIVVEHGEKHDSLGQVYLYYGKALLEVSREEAEPLGDAVRRDLNTESEDDEEVTSTAESSEAKDNQAKMETKTEEVTESDSNVKNGDVKEKTEKSDKAEETVGDSTEVSENSKSVEEPKDDDVTDSTSKSTEKPKTTPEGESKNGGTEGDEPSSSGISDEKTTEDDKEDPSDLQVAWEVLELAKLIFEQRADVGKKELAETLVVLGEVSLESENFESAIADIKQGLEIQKSILESDSRNLAETYYKLAIALSTNNQIDEAIENFNTSLDVLKSRINRLKKGQEKDEIKEIEGLIPEIEEKIADMKSFKEEAANKIASAIAAKPASEIKFAASSSEKQVSDISHLVKRKRKLEDSSEESEESPAKKQP